MPEPIKFVPTEWQRTALEEYAYEQNITISEALGDTVDLLLWEYAREDKEKKNEVNEQ